MGALGYRGWGPVGEGTGALGVLRRALTLLLVLLGLLVLLLRLLRWVLLGGGRGCRLLLLQRRSLPPLLLASLVPHARCSGPG